MLYILLLVHDDNNKDSLVPDTFIFPPGHYIKGHRVFPMGKTNQGKQIGEL